MNRLQIAIITFLMLLIFSCDKNETEARTDIIGKWKATEFMSVESLPQVKSYQIESNNLKLEVPDWGWINLELND